MGFNKLICMHIFDLHIKTSGNFEKFEKNPEISQFEISIVSFSFPLIASVAPSPSCVVKKKFATASLSQ